MKISETAKAVLIATVIEHGVVVNRARDYLSVLSCTGCGDALPEPDVSITVQTGSRAQYRAVYCASCRTKFGGIGELTRRIANLLSRQDRSRA